MKEILLRDVTSILTADHLHEMESWCEKMFGPSKMNSRWQWIGGRWYLNGTYSFTFTDNKDALMFILKWVI